MRNSTLSSACVAFALSGLAAGAVAATEPGADQRRDMAEIQTRYAAELQPAWEQAQKSRTLIEYLNASGRFDDAEIARLAALYAEAVERMIVLHSRMNGELAEVARPEDAPAPPAALPAPPRGTGDTADLLRLPRAPRPLNDAGSISMFN